MNRRLGAVLSSLIAFVALSVGATIVGGEARSGVSDTYVAPASLDCSDPLIVSSSGPTDEESLGGLRFGTGQDMVTSLAVPVDLPAGNYSVQASTHDSYSFRADVSPQANEQVHLVITAGGEAVVTTGYSSDLADGAHTAWAVSELGSFTLDAPADGVTIEHFAANNATNGPNSLRVVALCIVGDAPEEPAAEEPTDDADVCSAVDDVVADDSVEEPAADEPATEEPAADEPAVEAPAECDEPVVDPCAGDSVEEPAADEPATEESAADEPAVEAPAECDEPVVDPCAPIDVAIAEDDAVTDDGAVADDGAECAEEPAADPCLVESDDAVIPVECTDGSLDDPCAVADGETLPAECEPIVEEEPFVEEPVVDPPATDPPATDPPVTIPIVADPIPSPTPVPTIPVVDTAPAGPQVEENSAPTDSSIEIPFVEDVEQAAPIPVSVNQQTPGQGALPVTGTTSGLLVMIGLSLAIAGLSLLSLVGRRYATAE